VPESAEEFIARKKAEWPGQHRQTEDQQATLTWVVEEITLRRQHNLPTKVLSVERWRLADIVGELFYEGGARPGDVEYRLAYLRLTQNGQWGFGRSAVLIPRDDLQPLLRQAREEGTILEGAL
jgi:hypothetical protein